MERIWRAMYADNVKKEVVEHPYSSLTEAFDSYCSQFPENVAFSNFGVNLSFSQLQQKVNDFAAYLQSHLGVSKGDRVAIMMPNLLQYPITLHAVLKCGAIVVNINPLYTPRELRHALLDSGANVIVICENFAKTLSDVIGDVKVEHVVITELGDSLGLKGKLMNWVVKHVKRMVPAYNLPSIVRFNHALKRGQEYSLESPSLTTDDLAFLQYTGGTTGPSKGAELSHGNILANTTQMYEWIKDVIVSGKDSVVTPLPLYHIFSLTVCCLTFPTLGAECILITNPRDIPGFVKLLKKRMGTCFVGLNTLYNALVMNDDFNKLDFSQLKYCISGGMATQHAVNKKWFEKTGVHILEGYGLTETSPVLTFNPTYVNDFSGSIGVPLPNTELSIRDEDGDALPAGKKGELWARGPQVMRRYWNKPKESEKVLTPDGWFKTGDIGLMDKQGWFYLVDRKKDMVIVSGFNVYPNEIEGVLVEHEGVLEAAVIGVKSEKTGEALKAFVVTTDPGLSEDDLKAFCRKNMTAYKVPKIFEFKNDLPKSNVGKVLRRALRDCDT
jgi:long-chain acyl-CoA synthetase